MALVGLVLLFGQTAWACSCVATNEDLSLREKVESAKNMAAAVFTGKVLEITKVSNSQNSVKFEIDLVWKGVDDSEVSLVTGSQSGADCGFAFETGKNYLVYAFEHEDGALGTNICQRTNLAEDSEDEMKILNETSGY